MRRDHSTPAGEVHRVVIESEVLKSNRLGDPTRRAVDVYVPHGHDGKDLPMLVDLAGFTGSGLKRSAWNGFAENMPERLDRLIASGELKSCVMVFPDCFTRLGGNQYINSEAVGRWGDYLIEEMVPAVEKHFGCGGDGKRGVLGKSSGGYAAMYHGMKHADFWSAIGVHSGDMGFEVAYLPDMPIALRALAKHGTFENFLNSVEASHDPSHTEIHALMIFAMGATYDPDPNAFCGVTLPVDTHTCELDQDAWARWLKWDPLHIFDEHVGGLKKLKGIWIDCGDVDQFNFVYVARRMERKLKAAGVDHVYEEFPDNHFSIDYRYDKSVPYLVNCLS